MCRATSSLPHRSKAHLSSAARRAAAPLAFYALLTLLITFPILFQTGTRAAGYDYFSFHWNFWWMRHALNTPGQPLYLTDYVFFPYTNNLAYHSLAPVWYPLWALLEPLIGTLAAMTAILLLACLLNGYVMYLFLRAQGAHSALALIGGAALQLLPITRYFVYNTHLNLLPWFWLPLHLLLWKGVAQAIEGRQHRRALLLAATQGVGLWALILTDQQLPLFLALLLGPYALATLWRARRRWLVLLAGLGINAIGVGLAWAAGPLPYLLGPRGGFARGNVEDRPGIPFPDGFLSMSERWWLWDQPSLGAFLTVAVALSLVVGLGSRRAGKGWLWFALMLPPLVLALGPTLTLGPLRVPLPYRAVYELSGGLFAMPWRLGPVVALAGLTFAALTWTPILRTLGARRVLALSTALFIALGIDLRLGESAPLDAIRPAYAFYEAMGRETCPGCADYVVLEVPTAVGTGEVLLGNPQAIALQYHALAHGKRLVNGFLARAPVDHFWWVYQQDPMMAWLGQRRLLEPETVTAQLRERIVGWPIGYVVIHSDLIGAQGPTLQEILAFFNERDDLLCPYAVEGAAIAYRARWHPLGCAPRTPPQSAPGVYRLDIGSPGDEGFIGRGWHWQESIFETTIRWAGQDAEAQIWIDLPPGDYTIRLAAQSFHEARRLQLRVNGMALEGDATFLPDALRAAAFDVPASVIGAGRHIEIELVYDGRVVPASIGQSADPRPLAIMVDWMTFEQR